MFNLSGSEIIVILLLALVVLGPDKLPDAMRKAGKTFAELKKLSNGFQEEVRKGFEDPVKEVKKTVAAIGSATDSPSGSAGAGSTAGLYRCLPSDVDAVVSIGNFVAERTAAAVFLTSLTGSSNPLRTSS